MPVALGKKETAPVAVLLTEDESLLQKTVAGICSVDWTDGAALDEMYSWQVAQEAAALVLCLPNASNGALVHHQGSKNHALQHESAPEEREVAVHGLHAPSQVLLEQQRSLQIFGSSKASNGCVWKLCYHNMHSKVEYQQAVFSRHKEHSSSERARFLQLPANKAHPPEPSHGDPDSSTLTESRTPSENGVTAGQTGNIGVSALHLYACPCMQYALMHAATLSDS